MLERFHSWKDRQWERFVVLAKGPHALFWLGVCALTDPIFFPIPPEIYLAALMLAHPARWKLYLIVAGTCSVIGAALSYVIGAFLFHQFGLPLIEFYHLGPAFREAQAFLANNILVGMILVAFQLIPEKVFVLAAGFLNAPFLLFIIGFAIGRIIRLAGTVYLTYRFGMHILAIVKKYFLYFTIFLLAIVAYYVIVHWHLLPPSGASWTLPL